MKKLILFLFINALIFTQIFPQGSKDELIKILPVNIDLKLIEKIEYPFEINEEMKEWARRIGRTGNNQKEKARKLYEGILSKNELNIVYYNNPRLRPMGYKTAKEVFEDKDSSNGRFAVCGEYAYLYIALAREIGLNAVYVLVDIDKYGKEVNHACAGILIDGRAILVDPAYNSFDIKHKNYSFLSDREAVARHQINDAAIYSRRGSKKESIEKISIAIKINPDFYEAYTWLGDLFYNNKEYEKAYENYEKAIEINKNYLEAYYKKANSLERLGKIKEAYNAYEILSKYNFDNAIILYWSAKASYKLRDYEKAIEKLEKATIIKPNYKKGYGDLAVIYSELGKTEKANKAYKKLKELQDNDVEDFYWAGLSLYNIKHYQEAIIEFQKALVIDDEYKEVYYWMALSYDKMNKYELALKNYFKVLDLDKTDIKSYYRIGETYEKMGDSFKANESYIKLSKYDFKYSDAQYWAGMGYFKLKDYKKAEIKFKEAVWFKGANLNAQYYWGRTLFNLKNYNEAIIKFKKVISLDYEYELAYYFLALSYYKIDNYKEAKWILNKGLGINKNAPSMNYLMALIEFEEDNNEKAIKYFKKVLEIDLKNANAYYYLGYAYGKIGKSYEAKKYYEKALILNPIIERYQKYIK